MRTITLLLTPIIVFASGVQLTPTEHSSIHNSNNKPSIEMQKKMKMHRLHKLTEQDAARITSEETGEKAQSIKLTHSGNYLIYKTATENYRLTINALDGTVIDKEKI